MRTLATTLKTATRRLFGHSPLSPEWVGGFASTAPLLPPIRAPFTTADATIGRDFHGQPVTVAPGHVLISGDRLTGVSSTLRTFAVHAAKFPAARLHVYDSTGEWVALRLIAHRFVSRAYGLADGLSDDPAAADVLADLDSLHREMQRRTDHLLAVNADLTGAGSAHRVATVADLPSLPLAALRRAGIDPARTDTETAGLHRHAVVIPDLDWWLTHPTHGADITEKLFWIAGRGKAVGIHLVLAAFAQHLHDIPAALIDRIATRIALRITSPAHGDRMIGQAARAAGASTDETAHRFTPLLAYLVNQRDSGTLLRKVQLYRCTPMRLHRTLGWSIHDRNQHGWLTGDALALHQQSAADTPQPDNDNTGHNPTDDTTGDRR